MKTEKAYLHGIRRVVAYRSGKRTSAMSGPKSTSSSVTWPSMSVWRPPTGTDEQGISNNVVVSWELYEAEETGYCFLYWENAKPRIARRSSSEYQVEIYFSLNVIGDYRLRVATADLAGGTAVAWQPVSLMGKSG